MLNDFVIIYMFMFVHLRSFPHTSFETLKGAIIDQYSFREMPPAKSQTTPRLKGMQSKDNLESLKDEMAETVPEPGQ